MSEPLLSVGLDIGTTSTQLIFSDLLVENKAGPFSVPELSISQRKIRYKSDIHFTPLISGELVDATALRYIIDDENTYLIPSFLKLGEPTLILPLSKPYLALAKHFLYSPKHIGI